MANRLAAFPEQFNEWRSGQTGLICLPGMSRHLWVATHVLQGLLAGGEDRAKTDLVALAWRFADSMIAIDQDHEQGGGQ